MLITLPGPGSVDPSGPVIIDVDLVPASSAKPRADSQPSEFGRIDDAPLTTSALPAVPEPAAPPAPPESAPAAADAVPSAPPGTVPAVAEAAPPAPSETAPAVPEAASAKADSVADTSPPAEAPRQAEPDQSVPSVAEVAPSGTDPVTTQSATPVAVQGAPEQGPAEEAESTESGIDRLLQEPDRPAAPPVSSDTGGAGSICRPRRARFARTIAHQAGRPGGGQRAGFQSRPERQGARQSRSRSGEEAWHRACQADSLAGAPPRQGAGANRGQSGSRIQRVFRGRFCRSLCPGQSNVDAAHHHATLTAVTP